MQSQTHQKLLDEPPQKRQEMKGKGNLEQVG